MIRHGLGARSQVGYGLGVSAPRAAAGNGLLNNLVAYWALDEAAGANNALDKHSNGLTLTQVSSPGSAAGLVYAGARTFDGSADYFTRDSEALLQTGDVDQTFAIWTYLTNKDSDRTLLGKWNAPSYVDYAFRYQASSDRFRIVLGTGEATAAAYLNATTFGSPSLNTWYLVLVWYDAAAGNLSVSVNNGTADSVAKVATPGTSAAPFSIGQYSISAYFAGRIGPVAMWKSAARGGGVLTATQKTAALQ